MGGQLPNDVQTLEPGYVATVRALFRGSEIATLQHAFLALLIVGAFSYLVIKRKIVQVPNAWVSGPLAAFLALLLGSVFLSNYRWVSGISFAEWFVYALALGVSVAGLGRRVGPIAVISGLAAGSGLVAFLGIVEYGQMRSLAPDWRIFAGWNNPNALAGILLVGFFLNLGLLTRQAMVLGKTAEVRTNGGVIALGLAGCGVVCTGIALLLTGSKGAIFALAPALIAFIVMAIAWAAKSAAKQLIPAALCLLVIVIAGFGLNASAHGIRVANAGGTQEQSAGFRVQLWKGAAQLVRENPVGYGLDTYGYYSAKSGTNTRTELAHSTWLQLAVEAGFMAPIAFAALLIAWLWLNLRGARKLPIEQNILRASVIAAVAATAAHGLVESNLYYFGIGLAFFLLLGVGIQLSADAGAPEFVAPPMRVAAVMFAVLCLGQLLFAGFVGKLQSNVRWLGLKNQTDEARDTTATLRSIAPFDGETWFRSGFLAPNIEEALLDYERAAEVAPSAKYLRRLALVQAVGNKLAAAESTLRNALHLDPNNLSTLKQLMEVQDKLGLPQDAKRTAQQLVNVEATPYFKIRSIPEVVPTETFEARLYLAKTDLNKIGLLRQAVEGFKHFAQVTLPYVRQMGDDGSGPTPGVKEAEDKVLLALKAAKTLETLYRSAGDKAGEDWAQGAIAELEAALGGNK